jgi:RNA polymerase sigma-70 factor (ECF subfamily)
LAYACARVGWGWEDAEDVVSEVWVRALERIESYDPTRSFRAWIFGFATRVTREVQREVRLDLHGGHELARPSSIPDAATSVSRRVCRQEGIREFVTWLRRLNGYEREVMLLHGLEGWPFRKVGHALGRDEAAVQKCWWRLVARAREFPAGEGILVA